MTVLEASFKLRRKPYYVNCLINVLFRDVKSIQEKICIEERDLSAIRTKKLNTKVRSSALKIGRLYSEIC
jgi:hypothetical protein